MAAHATQHPALTARQKDVLLAAANGLTFRETAAELGISPETAKIHRVRVLRSLDSATIAQAVARAILLDLVDTGKITLPEVLP